MNTKTQASLVLQHFRCRTWITQANATATLGISRLAAIILQLKHMGYKFVDEWITVENRFGKECRVKRYRLDKG